MNPGAASATRTIIHTPTGTAALDATLAGTRGLIQLQGSTFTPTTLPAPAYSLSCNLSHSGDILCVAVLGPGNAVHVTGLGQLHLTAGGLAWPTGPLSPSQGIVANFATGTTTLLELTDPNTLSGAVLVNSGRFGGPRRITGPLAIGAGGTLAP